VKTPFPLRLVMLRANGGHATTGELNMKKSNFALRLQPSLMEEARKMAKAEHPFTRDKRRGRATVGQDQAGATSTKAS
jgi:hypothetical protein